MNQVVSSQIIGNKIYTIRGMQVMLDKDLAVLYDVETKVFNQAVKRNLDLFPKDFMFRLEKDEFANLRSQFVTSDFIARRYLPYAFTEQGVAMLSGVLKSKKAKAVNVEIMRAFVNMRRFFLKHEDFFSRLRNVERRQLKYETKIDEIFNALEVRKERIKQGIFFNGEIFDSFKFVIRLIRKAEKSLILIDNYIDETVLSMFNERTNGVNVLIITKHTNEKLSLILEKYNRQYPQVDIKNLDIFHDRFLIIDKKELYHIGASIKDLGKKCFGFSRMEDRFLKMLLDKIY